MIPVHKGDDESKSRMWQCQRATPLVAVPAGLEHALLLSPFIRWNNPQMGLATIKICWSNPQIGIVSSPLGSLSEFLGASASVSA